MMVEFAVAVHRCNPANTAATDHALAVTAFASHCTCTAVAVCS